MDFKTTRINKIDLLDSIINLLFLTVLKIRITKMVPFTEKAKFKNRLCFRLMIRIKIEIIRGFFRLIINKVTRAK